MTKTGDIKTPAYAVLIAILNLLTKWAPVLVVSGFLLAGKRQKTAMHTAIKERSQCQKCWLKDKY